MEEYYYFRFYVQDGKRWSVWVCGYFTEAFALVFAVTLSRKLECDVQYARLGVAVRLVKYRGL